MSIDRSSYFQDDPQVEVWTRLISPQCADLQAEAAQADATNVADVSRLRKHWPPVLVGAALELAAARKKAARKFDNAESLIADVSGVEQATSQLVAAHKARRYAELGRVKILDLCCGIGGDAMALAGNATVLGVDSSPLRAWMARHNAHCQTIAARVEDISLDAPAFHLDPSRRDELNGRTPRRHWRFEDYQPGPAFLNILLAHVPTGAVKLGPGIDAEELPIIEHSELEFISEHAALVQAVVWTGRLALHPQQRTATQLPSGAQLTGTSSRFFPVVQDSKPEHYLHAIDPAVERAELMSVLCDQLQTPALHSSLGLLTSDDVLASPWLTTFKLIAHMPWREQRVRDWLKAHNGGIVEIKTRGKAINPDSLQQRLRGDGDTPYTIFILRMDRSLQSFITSRTVQ